MDPILPPSRRQTCKHGKEADDGSGEWRPGKRDVDPLSSDLELAFGLIRQLLAHDDVPAAKSLGHRYLKVRRFGSGATLFKHMVHELPVSNPHYDALLAISVIVTLDRGDSTKQSRSLMRPGSKEFWHTAALAYCYFRLDDKVTAERLQCKSVQGYWDAVDQ